MDKNKIKVLLYGTGAVGSFYAGKLSQGGASVSVVSRSDYDVVKEHGIEIKSISGDFKFFPDKVLKSGAEYSENPDFVIIATKVLPEIDLYRMIKDSAKSETSIVILQNGIDIEKHIVEKFPDNEVISALAFICVSRIEYGVVEHQDSGKIIIGSYPKGVSDKVRILEKLFYQSGVPVEISGDIIMTRWMKLLWNAAFNPLSVICRADTRELLKNAEIKKLCIDVMNEVVMISRADGHPLDESMIVKNIEETVKLTPYKTSMLLDFENRRPMEVEAILGNTLKIAEKYKISPTHIKTLHALLSMINKKNLR